MTRIYVVVCSLLMMMGCKSEQSETKVTTEKAPDNMGYETLIININAENIDNSIDPNVDQDRKNLNSLNLESAADFGTNWSSFMAIGVGVIDIPEAGDYIFRLTSSGRVGMQINNKDLILDWDKHERSQKQASRKLEKGTAVFDFSYYPCEYNPLLVFEWSRDGENFEAIPEKYIKNTSIVDVEPWVDPNPEEQTQEPNTLSEEEIADGWKLLFDGKTTDGWHTYLKPGQIGSRWTVEDGTLKFDGYDRYFITYVAGKRWAFANVDKSRDGGVDIVTDEAFEDFDLRLEWKISEYGNSGIFYTVQEIPEYDEGWKSSPEMQVLHDQGQKDGMIRSHRSGDLYDLIECSERRTKGPGEWNKVRIVKNQGKVEHWMNGKMVLSYDTNSEEWKSMIANSKFAPYQENFALDAPGRIGLQDHDDTVWYRNIKIKKL